MFARLSVSLLCLMVLACGGDGGGSSPTQPEIPRLSTVLNFSGQLITFTGTVTETVLKLDGRVIDTRVWNGGCGGFALCLWGAQTQNVQPGRHTFTLTVTQQSRPELRYRLLSSGTYMRLNPSSTQQLGLEDREVRIRVNEPITWTFDLQ